VRERIFLQKKRVRERNWDDMTKYGRNTEERGCENRLILSIFGIRVLQFI